ncbi:MAG: hypothetical protein ACRDPD_27790, partial [Streptosporangiaceae bacterium]
MPLMFTKMIEKTSGPPRRIADGILADNGDHALAVVRQLLARQDIALVHLRNRPSTAARYPRATPSSEGPPLPPAPPAGTLAAMNAYSPCSATRRHPMNHRSDRRR